MKKALIVDITGLHKDGQLLAHMPKVAWNYYNVLSTRFETKIAGGEAYVNTFGQKIVYQLPYDCKSETQHEIGERISVKIHEIINTYKSLNSKNDIIIFQCYSRMLPILIGILLSSVKNKKIYIIQYFSTPKIGRLSKSIEKFLIYLVKKKITGLLCTSQKTGNAYNLPYYVVPDYFYIKDDSTMRKYCSKIKYDYGMFGFMSFGKDVELVINTFNNTSEKVIIAGRFSDEDRFLECKRKCSDNITIINKYLTEEEYNTFFNESRFILLPYEKGYNEHTSGVVLDAIFNFKPVICSNVKAFEFVKDQKLGILYNGEDMREAIDNNTISYEEFINNIHVYLNQQKIQIQHFLQFLDN